MERFFKLDYCLQGSSLQELPKSKKWIITLHVAIQCIISTKHPHDGVRELPTQVHTLLKLYNQNIYSNELTDQSKDVWITNAATLVCIWPYFYAYGHTSMHNNICHNDMWYTYVIPQIMNMLAKYQHNLMSSPFNLCLNVVMYLLWIYTHEAHDLKHITPPHGYDLQLCVNNFASWCN